MARMRLFNTKSMKLSTTQVRELYDRLMQGETQGSLAREFGISVIQVGRIARGEARAMETGAHENPVPNFNHEVRPKDVEASSTRLRGLLARPAAEPEFVIPPLEDDTNPAVLERFTSEIEDKLEGAQALEQLKGDSKS